MADSCVLMIKVFLESLYTKNRSPWDKVKHEVDYLLRVATAGSEEARKIKKAKNVFEKVYESKKILLGKRHLTS